MTNWSLLSADEFEELCTALLYKNNFYNVTKMGDANDSDRGRDIIGYKLKQIMSNVVTKEQWIIQCKRHCSSPPSIRQLKDSLDWCLVHKPNGVIFFITNRLTSDAVDWFESAKNDYNFEIKIIDIDYLENELLKDPQLYRKFFEKNNFYKDPWYEMLIGPRPNKSLFVYTAGEMPDEVERGAIGKWRQNIENEVKSKKLDVGFFHPEFVGCDHGGITADVTVSYDSYMIQKSDAVIAYLNNEELFGTITEIMLAHFLNKKIAIFIDENIIYDIEEDIDDPDIDDIEILETFKEDVRKIYQNVFKTKHYCPCNLDFPGFTNRNKYWFTLNYLMENGEDISINIVNKDNYSIEMLVAIEKWLSI